MRPDHRRERPGRCGRTFLDAAPALRAMTPTAAMEYDVQPPHHQGDYLKHRHTGSADPARWSLDMSPHRTLLTQTGSVGGG